MLNKTEASFVNGRKEREKERHRDRERGRKETLKEEKSSSTTFNWEVKIKVYFRVRCSVANGGNHRDPSGTSSLVVVV